MACMEEMVMKLLLVVVRFCHQLLLQANPIVGTFFVEFFGYI